NPVFKGRVGIMNAATGGGSTYIPFYVTYSLYGKEFMEKFAALEPRIFTSVNLLGAALASGDIDVAMAISETPLTVLYEQGAPIQWIAPQPAAGALTGQAISASAPHPNAARLYQEYAFADEGYGAWQIFGGTPAKINFA